MLAIVGFAEAKEWDCSVSREFQVAQPQVLSGVLKDQQGAVVNRLEMELLVGKRVFRKLRTSEDGAYDFGQIPSGRYRIRLRRSGGFCAPDVECGIQGCTPKTYVRIKSVPIA